MSCLSAIPYFLSGIVDFSRSTEEVGLSCMSTDGQSYFSIEACLVVKNFGFRYCSIFIYI